MHVREECVGDGANRCVYARDRSGRFYAPRRCAKAARQGAGRCTRWWRGVADLHMHAGASLNITPCRPHVAASETYAHNQPAVIWPALPLKSGSLLWRVKERQRERQRRSVAGRPAWTISGVPCGRHRHGTRCHPGSTPFAQARAGDVRMPAAPPDLNPPPCPWAFPCCPGALPWRRRRHRHCHFRRRRRQRARPIAGSRHPCGRCRPCARGCG